MDVSKEKPKETKNQEADFLKTISLSSATQDMSVTNQQVLKFVSSRSQWKGRG
jgi:type IV secretory pathway component VirB8